MPLYILKRLDTHPADYEQNRAVIARADDPPEARAIAEYDDYQANGVWLDSKTSSCIRLHENGPSRLIMHDNRGA